MFDRRSSVAHPFAFRVLRVAAVSMTCALAFVPVAEGGGRGGGGGGAGTGLHHFGMLHSPLGGATLSPQPDGSLAIENIGSSGQDGVSIDLGRSQGASIALRVASGGSLACETVVCKMGRVELALAGAGTGTGTTQEFGIVMTDLGGGVASIRPHLLNLTAMRTTIALRLAGETIGSTVIDGQLPSQFCTATLGQTGVEGITITSRAAVSNFSCEFVNGRYVMRAGVPLTFVVGNDPPRLADELEINYSINRGNNLNWPFGSATIQGSVASGTTTLTELEAKLQCLGLLARAAGGAHIIGVVRGTDDDDADLHVSNIGSSGQDGVSLDISSLSALGVPSNIGINEPIPDVTLHLKQPMDVSSRGTGLRFSVDGVMSSGPAMQEIAALHLQPLGGAITVHGDLTVAGSATLDVTVLSEGQVMGVVTVPDASMIGMITPAALGPPQVSSCRVARLGNPLVNEVAIGLEVSFDRVAEFRPPGLLPLACDQLRIAPTTPSNSVVACSTMHLLSAGGGGGGGAGGSFDIDEIRLGPVNGGVEIAGVTTLPLHGVLIQSTAGMLSMPSPGSVEPFGFAVPFGAAQGAMVTSEISFAAMLAIESRDILRTYFETGDIPTADQFARLVESSIDRQDTGETIFGLSVFGFTPEEIRSTARLAGEVVRSVDFGSTMPPQIASVQSPSSSAVVTHGCSLHDLDRDGHPDVLRVVFSEPIAFSASIGTTGAVLADEIVVEIRIVPADPIQACAMVSLAEGVPSRTVTDIATMQFDLPHRAVGDSRTDSMLCGDTTHFLVDNIGSSGNDGVSISLRDPLTRPANSAVSGFVLDATRSEDDGVIQTFRWATSGLIDGAPPAIVSSASFELSTSGGAGHDIIIDPLTWMTPSNVVTRAYLGEQLVSESSGTSLGLVAWTVTPTEICDKYEFKIEIGAAGVVESDGVRHTFVWDSAVDLGLPGGGATVLADRLEVRATGGGGGGSGGSIGLESMTVTGRGTVATGKIEVGITGETVIYHNTCPADTSGDSVVNVTDLLAVISGWGPCSTCPVTPCVSDTNRDCVTNVTDLLAVISAWGPCD